MRFHKHCNPGASGPTAIHNAPPTNLLNIHINSSDEDARSIMQVQDRARISAYQRTQHSQQQFKRTNVQYNRLYTFTTTTFHIITDCSPPQASAQNWRGTQLTIQVQNGKRWKLQQRVIAPRRVHLFRRISPPVAVLQWHPPLLWYQQLLHIHWVWAMAPRVLEEHPIDLWTISPSCFLY